MIDNIFIKYANSSLRDNPGILLDLYREFAESGYVRFITQYWKDTHEMTFEWHDKFAKFDNYPDALEAYNELKNELENELKNKISSTGIRPLREDEFTFRLQVAFRGVWACEFIGCENCAMYLHYDRFILMAANNHVIYGPQKIRCQECNQLKFRVLLASISKGKTLTTALNNIIEGSTKFIRTQFSADPENGPLIKKERIYHPKFGSTDLPDDCVGSDLFFYLTTHDFIGLSLAKFLDENDRRKLKYCEECTSFYIAKTLRNQRFCSGQCRLSHHNRKRIESGEAMEYKRKKRREGAKKSYYG
jgi:hypothetical protein